MESTEHSLLLKDGRTLAYHIFGNEPQKDSHPVLYFNGFPGCGIEAGIACAPAVAKCGGQVFAIDRPGMGKTSSPYGAAAANNNNKNPESETNDMSDADRNLDTFMGNIWELVEDQGWEEFSVVGASGGGPYTLALLASYLQRRKDKTTTVARLRNVCLVGAICLSAGQDGMKEELAQLNATVEKAQTSKWYRFQLAALCASTGPIYRLLPYMPLSWNKYLIALSNKTSPEADREFLSKEENFLPFLEMMGAMAPQGGYPGIYDDAMILVRANLPHEEVLRKIYGSDNVDDLPSIGIFQGQSDTNVPPSHAEYLHKSIFHEQSRIFRYEGLGHPSTIMGKPEDYAAFATAERKK